VQLLSPVQGMARLPGFAALQLRLSLRSECRSPSTLASIGSCTSARIWIFQTKVGKSETTPEFSIQECLPDSAMKPTAHQCDLPGVHWAKVSDSAVFRVLHVLFQQRSASSICNSKTAETVWRYEAERAKLTRDFHWHWRRIPFRIRSGPNLAQPVEIFRRQVRMRSSPHFYTWSNVFESSLRPKCLNLGPGGSVR
jgi:hypothetical protein